MGAVDYSFYTSVYMGDVATQTTFPALCARASDVVGALTKWVDVSTLRDPVLTLYKKAVCAQIDFFGINGLDIATAGEDRGFTVGKVTVNGKTGGLTAKGRFADDISPLAVIYLEQTGLLNPQVQTVGW